MASPFFLSPNYGDGFLKCMLSAGIETCDSRRLYQARPFRRRLSKALLSCPLSVCW